MNVVTQYACAWKQRICNLHGEGPTGTHVNFDGNFSQHEYQIHFQPFTDAEYQTAFYSEPLSRHVLAFSTLGVLLFGVFSLTESPSSPGR